MSRLQIPTQAEVKSEIFANLPDLHLDAVSGKDGEEIYETVARLTARLIGKIADWTEAGYILRAAAATRATATITITWTAGTGDAGGILTGQRICKTPWGVTYRLSEDLAWLAGQGGGYSVDVAVEADWRTFDGGTTGAPVEAEFLDTWALPGGVDPATSIDWASGTSSTAKTELLDGVADGSITVEGDTDATGGALGLLDLIGQGQGTPRAEGETDLRYRRRLRFPDEALTPNAIKAAIDEILDEAGLGASTYQEAKDHGLAIGHATQGCPTNSPPVSHPSFVLFVGALTYSALGLAIGDQPNGTPNVYPIGAGDPTYDAFYLELQAVVDAMRAGGVCGRVVRGTAP